MPANESHGRQIDLLLALCNADSDMFVPVLTILKAELEAELTHLRAELKGELAILKAELAANSS